MTVQRIATRAIVPAAIAMAALFALSPAPQAAPKRGDRVTVTGCPYRGVTAGCLLIRARDGSVYNISSVSPRPRESGRMIRLHGAVTERASMCAVGVVLERIRWTRTRQRCPK
jgi:hypothetical protein